MKYENLSKLVDIVKDKLNEYNHFVAEISYGFDFRKEFNQAKNTNIISTQRGVMRTNCMDCLDRTNVVQSVFSRQILFV